MEEPWCVYLPLLELGYSSFADHVTEDREPAIIETVELRRRHGNKVKDKHKLALNKLISLDPYCTKDFHSCFERL